MSETSNSEILVLFLTTTVFCVGGKKDIHKKSTLRLKTKPFDNQTLYKQNYILIV